MFPGTPAASFVLALAAAVLASACVATAPDRPPHGAPRPPDLPEIRSAAPAPGMVWVAGTWHWDGTDWVWLPGRWESPPPLAVPDP